MKNYIVLIAVFITFSVCSFAQESSNDSTSSEGWKQKSIFESGNGKMDHGFYGGLMTRYAQIDGQSAFLIGVKGAWVINHSLGIGLAGNNLMKRTYTSANKDIVKGYLGGNGGFLLEPVLYSDRAIHVALPVVFGGGYISEYVFIGKDYWDKGDYVLFGYIEPGIEVELNVVKWFRVSFGAYYAFRPETETNNMSSDIVSPLSLGAAFKFGMF